MQEVLIHDNTNLILARYRVGIDPQEQQIEIGWVSAHNVKLNIGTYRKATKPNLIWMGIDPQEQQTEFICVLAHNSELNSDGYRPSTTSTTALI